MAFNSTFFVADDAELAICNEISVKFGINTGRGGLL
jgi:hypothetical protein